MAMIELKPPSKRDLQWFGLMVAALCGVIGGIVLWQSGSLQASKIIWATGVVFSLIYYAIPPLRMILYYGWMKAVTPIGWTVSHLVLAITYYLVLTPTGLLVRLFRRDPMRRKPQPDAATYWTARRPARDSSRYFNQY